MTRQKLLKGLVIDLKSSDGSMTPNSKEVELSKEDLQGALEEALKVIAK